MSDDIAKIREQAERMQAKLQELQTELDNAALSAEAGGGLVRVHISGRGFMKQLEIDPSLLAPQQATVLQDLVIAAYNDARRKADQQAEQKAMHISAAMRESFGG